MAPNSCAALSIIAALISAITLPHNARAQSGVTPSRATGTFEMSWYSIDVETRKPSMANLLLVLSPQFLPESLTARMEPGHWPRRNPASVTACWRMTSGRAAMTQASPRVLSTDWETVGADSVAVLLWFAVDAGSNLRFKLSGDSLRGTITSSGHMGIPSRGSAGDGFGTTLRDSVAGRRIGEPDARRCFA